MKEVKIDVEKGDEEEISKIQSWVDRVSEKWISDLKSIHLLNDMTMTNVMKNLIPKHPHPENINGLFHDGVILLRKRKDDDRASVEGSFYHEVGHLIFEKKDWRVRIMYRRNLFDIWKRFVGRFSYYYDSNYANDEAEIYARVYSYFMLVTAGKVKPIVDLPSIVDWAMKSMEEMFS
jgi:hypothetical protein